MNARLRALPALVRSQSPAVAGTTTYRNQLVRCASAPVVFVAAGPRRPRTGIFRA